MITIKLAIKTDKEDEIIEYQKQYSNTLHVYFNRLKEGLNQTQCKHLNLNNIDLLDSWFKQSCVYEANALLMSNKEINKKKIKENKKETKVIFGGKKNYFDRLKGLISKEQFKLNKLNPIYSIGEANNPSVKCNRKFFIESVNNIIFKPNKNTMIDLNINCKGKYNKYLNQLMIHQEQKDLSITYKLSSEYIWITFDESILKEEIKLYKPIKDRIISLDVNPNYIGYSIIDWIDDDNFNIIDKGVLSLKSLTDKYNELKKLKLKSNDKQKIYLNNKRTFEVFEVSNFLIDKMKHYKCSLFAIEDLNIVNKNHEKGKNYNRLINNLWNRNRFINNLKKYCNLYNVKLIEVKAEYSSYTGNIVYRYLKLPDMILSSIEISRRCYQFNHQYILKDKEIKKNIIWIELTEATKRLVCTSLEELCIDYAFVDLRDLYSYLKKSKCKYRFPLDSFQESFSPNSLKFKLIT